MKTIVHVAFSIALIFAGTGVVQAQGKLNKGTETPVEKGGPYDRVYHPENAPAPEEGRAFPQEWLHAYGNPARNAVVAKIPENAPAWVKEGSGVAVCRNARMAAWQQAFCERSDW